MKGIFLIALSSILWANFLDGYYIQKAKEEIKNRHYKEALKLYNQIDIDNDYIRYNRANLLYHLGRFKEAFLLYQTVEDFHLQSAKLYNMANSLVKLKEFKRALIFYKTALKFSPDDKDIKYNIKVIKEFLDNLNKELKRVDLGVRSGVYEGKSLSDKFDENITLEESKESLVRYKKSNFSSNDNLKRDKKGRDILKEDSRDSINSDYKRVKTSIKREYYYNLLRSRHLKALLIPIKENR